MNYHRFSIVQGRAAIDKRITNAQFRTLAVLGSYADIHGWCFPSQSTIGEDLGKSRQTVNEDIAALVEYGYVEKDSVVLPNHQIRMRYRLLHDPIPTGGVSENRQGVSEYPDSNDSSNDSYNTSSGEETPLDDPEPSNKLPIQSLPIEWQISAGVKEVVQPSVENSEYIDRANLISTGLGIHAEQGFTLAYSFMKTRGIAIPVSKVKGNRKAVREMLEMNVTAAHVEEATKQLMEKHLTVVDLFSVSKTAIGLANPAPDDYEGPIEGV